jgi:hypothetical protein
MKNQVAVMGLDADDGKTILVVVCINPITSTMLRAYASKDGTHVGTIIAGTFCPAKDAELMSANETRLIVRAHFALRNSIANVLETEQGLANQLTLNLLESK